MSFGGFTNPIGLMGLASLPIVLALHLLRERRRQFRVSSLSLWSFLEAEVRGSLPRRIPITWLLILDFLIAILLSLAWARPHLMLMTKNREALHLVVLLDVSSSMRAQDIFPSRFSQAKAEAISLLSGLGPRDIATVVTFGSSPHWIGDTRDMPLQKLLALLNNLEAGETGNELSSALALALSVIPPQSLVEVHILTDASYSNPDINSNQYSIIWHLYGEDTPNQAVINISNLQVSENQSQVFARIANYSNQHASRAVSFLVDNNPLDTTIMKFAPNSIISQTWTVSGIPSSVSVMLSRGDHQPEDDVASLGFHSGKEISVALVAEEPSPLDRALNAIPGIRLQTLPPSEYMSGMQFDVFVFRKTLPKNWPPGVIIVLEPPKGNELLRVEDLVEISEQPILVADRSLAEVDFNGVRWTNIWTLESLPSEFEVLIKADNYPLLVRGQFGLTQVFIFLSDLNSGNLTRHPSFPILIANLVDKATQNPLPLAQPTGVPLPLLDTSNFPFLRIIPPTGEPIEFNATRPKTWEKTLDPGIYQIEAVDINGQEYLFSIGVNAGSEAESDLRLQDWVKDGQQEIHKSSIEQALNEIDLTPWILGLTILLLILEAKLAWR